MADATRTSSRVVPSRHALHPALAPPPITHTLCAVDVNQLTELVVVGANGSLHQRSIYVDDCMLPVMPLLCFAVGADEGSLVMEQLVRAL